MNTVGELEEGQTWENITSLALLYSLSKHLEESSKCYNVHPTGSAVQIAGQFPRQY